MFTNKLNGKQRKNSKPLDHEFFPDGAVVRNPPANVGDTGDAGSIPGSGRSPGEGNDNPLQDSCLENSMNRGGL